MDGNAKLGFFACKAILNEDKPKETLEPCREELSKPTDHFCPRHSFLRSTCCIQGCHQLATDNKRTCPDSRHREAEANYVAPKLSMHHRRTVQSRPSMSSRDLGDRLVSSNDPGHPDTRVEDLPVLDGLVIEEDEVFEVSGAAASERRETDRQQGKIRGEFSRRRTHNEEFRCRCCGIIVDMATFYISEGVSTCVVSSLRSQSCFRS